MPEASFITLDFKDLEKDFFYEPEYLNLNYKDLDIFGRKKYYINYIKKIISSYKKIDFDVDNKTNIQKIFAKNKQKKIILTLNSLSVKIYELKKDSIDGDENEQKEIFKYDLPFTYLPLFYYKGEEKFKIFLSKIIKYDNISNKFSIDEKADKIFKETLKHCLDYNLDEPKEDEIKSSRKLKKSSSNFISRKQTLKRNTQINRNNSNNQSNEGQNISQKVGVPNVDTYITNLEEIKKKFDNLSESVIYPSKKYKNFMNFNIFEFLWITPDKIFKVCIYTPLIYVDIPSNKIKVAKYIDFELLFYIFEKKFKNWDFYVVKYLSSFKVFRSSLKQINSIDEINNKNFFISTPKIKNYSFNEVKMVHIISTKPKNSFENLIQDLGKDISIEEKTNYSNSKKKSNMNLITSTIVIKCFIAYIRIIDTKINSGKEFKVYFNFNQLKKFIKMEKHIDRISFLIKFIDFDFNKKNLSFNYKALDEFDEKNWIKNFKEYIKKNNSFVYNNKFYNVFENRISAEYLGIFKNFIIQIDIFTPISLIRNVNELGYISTDKILLKSEQQNKIIPIKNDNIAKLIKIFYDSFADEKIKSI